MTSPKFEELYAKLNSAQKEAVDTIEGPVMVVAGPGTGKTQILTLRIANILTKTDTNPENILALTFTEAAAASMRRRLAEIIGSPAYAVTIGTFHGFCNDIIKNYPENFPRIISSEHLTEVEQIKVLEELIAALPLKELKPFGDQFFYLRPILANLNALKRENVDVAGFKAIVAQELKNFELIPDLYHDKGAHKGKMKGDYQRLEKQLFKNQELAGIYAAYEEKLAELRRYDWNDMIMEVVRALAGNAELLLQLQEKYQYVLVDEHQDTNNAQNRLIELLMNFHPNPNLFVVGDEKQAIFRFQGASLENFLYFKQLYSAARLVFLEENYRSTQHILDAAGNVIASPRPLQAKAGHPSVPITLHAFASADAEEFGIASIIKGKIEGGMPAQEIAVLYRDNRDAFPVAWMLQKFGIPYVIESDEDILRDHQIQKLILVFRAIANFGNDEHLANALHADFLKLDPLSVYKLIEGARANRASLYDVLRGNAVFADFGKALSSWALFARNRGLEEAFELVVRESGFLSRILSGEDPVAGLDKLTALFDEARAVSLREKHASLSDFLSYLDTIQAHGVLVRKHGNSHYKRGVRLMTAHKSKGLEFDAVFVVNAFDGHWGGRARREYLKLPPKVFALSERKIDEQDDVEDERRLFYVALTRARKEVTITYSKAGRDGRELLPSQFIGEIKPELLAPADPAPLQARFAAERHVLFAVGKSNGISLRDKEFIKSVFDKNGLSVTALNNYLECPWKYFYTNLLRIPRAPEKHQKYGIAIHAALKDFVDNGGGKEALLKNFESYLSRESFKENEFAEWLERGKSALSGYYDFYQNTWPAKNLTELNIGGILLTPEIRLTGKIDKIEFLNDGEVNVVDYKTGSPKSRGEIEGATKNSNGDIKRQLVFYNLLLNKHDNGRYKMVSGEIDFVEPGDNGKYKKEKLIILPEEVLALEEQIKTVGAEILSGAFWDKKCDDRDCEFCVLRSMI
jgi:DNA helicase-2/ATP-dependent DNA helicase PcrA